MQDIPLEMSKTSLLTYTYASNKQTSYNLDSNGHRTFANNDRKIPLNSTAQDPDCAFKMPGKGCVAEVFRRFNRVKIASFPKITLLRIVSRLTVFYRVSKHPPLLFTKSVFMVINLLRNDRVVINFWGNYQMNNALSI